MIVNGETLALVSIPQVRYLTDLIAHFKLNPQAIAVEMNGTIPKREQWQEISLKDEDKIELIRFVGGG